MFNITNYVTTHLQQVGAEVGGSLESALRKFEDWFHKEQLDVEDSIKALEARGYTVTPPPTP